MANTLTQIASNTTLAITELQNFASSAVTVAVTVTPTAGDLVVWASATTFGDLPQVGTTNIANSAVTYAKIQNEATVTLLGNPTGSPAAPSEITLGTNLAFAGSVLNATSTTPGLTYLGTINTVSNAIVDQPSGTNVLGANNATYRSFKLIFKNIIPGTTSILLLLQVHTGGNPGTFQTSNYIGTQAGNVGSGFGQNTRTDSVPLTNSMTNSTPGYNGEATVSGLSGSSAVKVWFTNGVYWNGSNAGVEIAGGFWNGGNNAIDGFQIVSTSGNITSGSVDVYGML